MDPHLRILLSGRVRNQGHGIPGVESIDQPVPAGEDGAVDRGPEPAGATFGERGRASLHTDPLRVDSNGGTNLDWFGFPGNDPAPESHLRRKVS